MQRKQNTAMGLTLAALAGAGGMILVAGARSVQSAPVQKSSGGWQTYKDAHLGFTVARPAGWTVRADGRSIVVQDPARREVMLTEVFTASPGDTAEAHLNRLAQDQAALFPDAEISDAAPQPSKGDAVAASVSYGNGTGQGRALCSIVNGKGMLFVLAAPGSSFGEDQPVLAHIVKSLRFTVPAASAGAAKGAGRVAASQAAATVHGMQFVRWTDPREHGFQVDIPKGWTAEGGAFRSGPLDLRIGYWVTSPAKDMQVVMGDPRLPGTLVTPNEMLGARDGMNGCSHYMLAPEFNRWYLENLGRQSMDNVTIGADHPLPEFARQKTLEAQQVFGNMGEVEVSAGATEFSGLSKLTHKQISGVVIGTTQRMTMRGFGGGSTTWIPGAIVLTCNDDASKTRNQQIVMAVFARLQKSYHEDPAWLNKMNQEDGAANDQLRHNLAQNSQQMIADSKARSAEITRNSDAARDASMGAYWGHVNADNEQQRGFANYMGDRTDVAGADGVTHTVQSGSSHYYQNAQTGVVVGTDSAYSPGVDFTPLTER
jgi:hypothetical protein